MPKFEITASRLIPEECKFFVDAKDEEHAKEVALATLDEVGDLVWQRTNDEPQSYGIENVKKGDNTGW